MRTEHLENLVALYKLKADGRLTDTLKSAHLAEAKMELDKAIIEDRPTDEINEYISELNLL